MTAFNILRSVSSRNLSLLYDKAGFVQGIQARTWIFNVIWCGLFLCSVS